MQTFINDFTLFFNNFLNWFGLLWNWFMGTLIGQIVIYGLVISFFLYILFYVLAIMNNGGSKGDN